MLDFERGGDYLIIPSVGFNTHPQEHPKRNRKVALGLHSSHPLICDRVKLDAIDVAYCMFLQCRANAKRTVVDSGTIYTLSDSCGAILAVENTTRSHTISIEVTTETFNMVGTRGDTTTDVILPGYAQILQVHSMAVCAGGFKYNTSSR